jgi:FtsP/CotA-like multicopper oxidase with cupredoxin domain
LHGFLVLLALLGGHASEKSPPAARANDNRLAAGDLKQGVFTLQLELMEATWYPEQEGGPNLRVYAFAEKGKAPQIPGPMIRVPQGTEVRVHLHNTLPVAMFVLGLYAHGSAASEPLQIAPGGTAEARFAASSPGTYYYTARSTRQSIKGIGALTVVDDLPMGEEPFRIESQLNGVLVVDPPGSIARDRIFMITNWMTGVITPPFQEVLAINGKSWPYTERLSGQVGEAAHWRLINVSLSDHAMHLHGFHFQVTSIGDQEHDRPYPPEQVPHAVTQHMDIGTTASIAWTPERAGRWLFHCHMTGHMAPDPALFLAPAEHESHSDGAPSDSAGMRSLVLGITVAPGPSPAAQPTSNQKPRQLRLLVREKPATRFSLARMGYLIQEGDAKETTDPPSFPGAPLVLTRGELTEITVVNQLHEQTSVHWHGMELESYFDGVPGWGGDSPQVTPSILPGGSFLARMTPPRAGTFIYHTHWHDVAQLTSGLYGPLIVVEPGQKFDPEVDKVFILSREGPDESHSPQLLNGTAQPPAVTMKIGTKYRLRFINIATNDSDSIVSLLRGSTPVTWRAIAKDGWTFPPAQATMRPARQPITVGETYDFEFAPDRAGEFTLEVTAVFLKTKISQSITAQ